MAEFELDQRLASDCIDVTDWPLCRVLLMNDRQYPWCILVPKRAGISELHQLNEQDYAQFCQESRRLSIQMMSLFEGFKLNIAALGNVVRQLHIHHVVRFENDPVWPAPVWGKLAPVAYDEAEMNALLAKLREVLA